MDFIWFLLIGAVAGWLAGQIMKGSGFGMFGNIVVGVLGAVIGGWLFGALGFSISDKLIAKLVTALVGAVVLLFILGLISKKKK
jgi:uncharacterized membrane protein YeaQ/YmgE (transglycosylase-associated protein family)